MEFSWDERKDVANRIKHGLSFSAAARVFDDPNAVSYVERVVEVEERWHTIGLAGGLMIVLVAHTVEDNDEQEEIRIISAREANRREKTLYFSPERA